MVLSFAAASSGIAPLEAVAMNNPPVFFTFAPSVWMKLIACFSSTPLKIGVSESNTTVTGPPLALAMKDVIWIFSSVRSDGSFDGPLALTRQTRIAVNDLQTALSKVRDNVPTKLCHSRLNIFGEGIIG